MPKPFPAIVLLLVAPLFMPQAGAATVVVHECIRQGIAPGVPINCPAMPCPANAGIYVSLRTVERNGVGTVRVQGHIDCGGLGVDCPRGGGWATESCFSSGRAAETTDTTCSGTFSVPAGTTARVELTCRVQIVARDNRVVMTIIPH